MLAPWCQILHFLPTRTTLVLKIVLLWLSCVEGTRGPESRAQTSVAFLPGIEGAQATKPRDPASAALLPEAEGAEDTEQRDSTSAAKEARALDPRDPASITMLDESAQSEEQGAATSRKHDFTPGTFFQFHFLSKSYS